MMNVVSAICAMTKSVTSVILTKFVMHVNQVDPNHSATTAHAQKAMVVRIIPRRV